MKSSTSQPPKGFVPFNLGAFELWYPIGKGGMGEVWYGIHTGQNIPVAVKVINPNYGKNPKFVRAFHNEVRAVAKLDHPAIVMVLDYGEVTVDAAKASNFKLATGSPFLVMEYLSGGSFKSVVRPTEWPQVQNMLSVVLDALAYAHARDVIHRDLKPGNVLIGSPDDARPGPKLIDFGLATASQLEDEGDDELGGGTPAFQAPEQIQWWRRREQGPWTDLYAVGCLTYAILTGLAPFYGSSKETIQRAHLSEPIPELVTSIETPPGLELWLERLLAKNPSSRFRRAADAAFALNELSAAWAATGMFTSVQPDIQYTGSDSEPPSETIGEELTETIPVRPTALKETTSYRGFPTIEEDVESEVAQNEAATDSTQWFSSGIPPFPVDWKRPATPAAPLKLVGAGLSLYGLRKVGFVNRTDERDKIWRALSEVRRNGRARLLLLSGAAGNGKSRLVEWVCERAHEVGTASVLKTSHAPIADSAQGLPRMVARHLNCVGLSRDMATTRISRILRRQGVRDTYECNGLLELLFPSVDVDRTDRLPAVQPVRSTERYVIVQRLLERESQKRPIIVFLDDIQWGSDSLAFAIHLLRAQEHSPSSVLVLATLRDDALAERPVESMLVLELLSLDGADSIRVPKLPAADHKTLVGSLLGRKGPLANEVENRTCGNPLFAVQLIGDWIRRGVLTVADTGVVLRLGEEPSLPDDIHQVWTDRVESLLDEVAGSFPPTGGAVRPVDGPQRQKRYKEASAALELAAVLGHNIENDEWEAVCDDLNQVTCTDLIETLLSSRLAEPTESGWTFVHGMLRESLVRRVMENDLWKTHNRRCADVLKGGYLRGDLGVAERIARHFVDAGDEDQALQPLLRAAKHHMDRSEFRSAIELLDKRDELLSSLSIPQTDPQHAEGWLHRTAIFVLEGRFDEAFLWAERTATAARRHDWDHILPQALFWMGDICHHRGQLDKATPLLEQAQRTFEDNGAFTDAARCQIALGYVAKQMGEFDTALSHLQAAYDRYVEADNTLMAAYALRGLAAISRIQGNPLLSREQTLQSRAFYLDHGNQFGVASCENGLGEIERSLNNLDLAEKHYRTALSIVDSIGSTDGLYPRLNLSLVLLERRLFDAARNELSVLMRTCKREGVLGVLADIHALMLPCAAASGDWETWDHHYERANQLIEETGLVETDTAWAIQLAGEIALEKEDWYRARQAFLFALELWTRLNKQDQIQAIKEQLRNL